MEFFDIHTWPAWLLWTFVVVAIMALIKAIGTAFAGDDT